MSEGVRPGADSVKSILPRRSMMTRSAVFLPMPETRVKKAMSPLAMACLSSWTLAMAKTPSADLGPIPETEMSLIKNSSSSFVSKP